MSVVLFVDGLEVTDDQAVRLSSFCESVFLRHYMDEHDDNPPAGWPNPQARRTLAEWTIRKIVGRKLRDWERRQAIIHLDDPDPWEAQNAHY